MKKANIVLSALPEFALLLGLWMLFVSKLQLAEAVVGVFAAVVATIADSAVKGERFARFAPHSRDLLLVFWTPWSFVRGTILILGELARRLLSTRSRERLTAVPFHAGGEDAHSSARRAVAITFTSISPDTIVIGIDHERNFMLMHLLPAQPVPKIAKRLGARG
jgi:multisubunit Na+/H+ antiporter MnhE subunit